MSEPTPEMIAVSERLAEALDHVDVEQVELLALYVATWDPSVLHQLVEAATGVTIRGLTIDRGGFDVRGLREMAGEVFEPLPEIDPDNIPIAVQGEP